MAFKATVTITSNKLPLIARRLPEAAGRVVKKTAFDVEAGAKAVVPVDTGNLKNSIAAEMTGPAEAIVGTGVEYSVYVELGTVKMAARPYLIPAAEHARPSFIEAMSHLERMLA